MIVIVAEKPSVGADIARVLKCRQKGDGFYQNDQYTVTWALGHLISLCEPDEIDEKYKKWKMEDLPILPDKIPVKVLPKTKKQFNVVKKLICGKETTGVICATDAGREGEYIFRLIYQVAGCKKSVQRLWISSMTDAAIKEGFEQLKPAQEYDGLFESAKCRSEADWLVGMNASRAFTLRYNALLSIGRVQTPTLAILVKRHHEINSFKPEEYFTVTADFGDYNGMWFDPAEKDEKKSHRIQTKEAADAIAKRSKGKTAAVADVLREEKKEYPPLLYDLTSLQRDANTKLGFTADKTLKLTQELYEKWKAVTYPRTDSKYLPPDMIGRTNAALEKLPEKYRTFVENIPRKEGKLPFSKRVFDASKVSDHHAIIPTPQTAALEKIPPDCVKVFDLISRRTIAVFYPPQEYEAVKIITKTEEDTFKTTGKIVLAPGWKAVYAGNDSKKNEPEDALPQVERGDEKTVIKASVKADATKPPVPHTDASLLSAMENAGREIDDEALREQMKGSGLGTPATRAAIIERLVQVDYAARKGRTITATEKGVQLIGIAPEDITSPETTGKWELALHEIEKGNGDAQSFMTGIRQLAEDLTEFARKAEGDTVFAQETVRRSNKGKHAASAVKQLDAVCPLCGAKVHENSKAFGCSNWKAGCRFTLWKDCLKKGNGPLLNQKIIMLLLRDGRVAGSTGEVYLKDEKIGFIPKDRDEASVECSVIYKKAAPK